MPFERDWTRRQILKTAAAGGLTSVLNARPGWLTIARPPIPTGSAGKTSIRARATG